MDNNNTRASVAMAVYNGEDYLREQIDSVLRAMSENDELVISYDQSSDDSLHIIEQYVNDDKRVRLVFNRRDNAGIAGNYNNAIANCRGKYVFLCDQDDYWNENKIDRVIEAFKKTGANLVIHDGLVVDENLNSLQRTLLSGVRKTTSPVANFVKGRYWGCCMAFDRTALKYAAPFPKTKSGIPHDIFASIIVGMKGKVAVIDDVLIYHRLHQGNETPLKRRSLMQIIPDRISLLTCIVKRVVISK